MRPDAFVADATRYRAITDSTPGMAPPAGRRRLRRLHHRAGPLRIERRLPGRGREFNQEYRSLRDTIVANDSQNEKLPRTTAAPLVSRDDFVCVWRDLVTKIRPNAQFCANSFNANAVRNSCR